MSYLRNCWYAVCWEEELSDEPISKLILEEPIMLFRDSSNNVKALHDACPHRFAPLSLGKLNGDIIQCPYHGLQFDASGKCVHNPHGKGTIASALCVRAYPIAERYGMIWIWMGEAEKSDLTLLPNVPQMEDSNYFWVHDKLEITANYELVIDNLLDLTHVEFLHPFLSSPGNSERTTYSCKQNGDQVTSFYDVEQEPIPMLFKPLWGEDVSGKFADLHSHMHWSAPSTLFLDTKMDQAGAEDGGPSVPTVHWLTPQTQDKTSYFWAAGRNRSLDNPELDAIIRGGTQNAFENEDEPMIHAVRERMHSNDLFAHKPALLPIDEGAVRARRILAKLIKEETPDGAE